MFLKLFLELLKLVKKSEKYNTSILINQIDRLRI